MSFSTGGAPAAGLEQKFQEFLASGTFTPSAALIAAGGVVDIELCGGGGAGGGSIPATPGGGGGESRTIKRLTLASTAPIAVTIGLGGVPGAPGQNPGGNGQVSSFGALLTVPGGIGGTAFQAGGGGSGTHGKCGGTGLVLPASANSGGDGGGDGGGKGYAYPNAPVAGERGCGGGGAGYTLTTAAGAAGGDGYCLVSWWE